MGKSPDVFSFIFLCDDKSYPAEEVIDVVAVNELVGYAIIPFPASLFEMFAYAGLGLRLKVVEAELGERRILECCGGNTSHE